MKTLLDPFVLLRFAVFLLIETVAAVNLPYNPTQILSSPNSKVAYVLQPASSTSQQFQLNWIDLSAHISSAFVPTTTIQTTLPFLDNQNSLPFSASIDSNGTITVLVGGCSQGSTDVTVWSLTTGGTTKSIGTWSQVATSSFNGAQNTGFLASAILFASNPSGSQSNPKMYTFGGMCPWDNSTSVTWTSSASYFRSLLQIGAVNNHYDVNTVAARAPPVPQAGHSLTPLTPSYSNRTDGTVSASQSFLLLGGHTSTAFLNISQAAIYSLPQETWSYFSISSIVGTGTTGPVRDESTLEPRSGHTATLSADGRQIVIFGGWVGDVNTAASPQLLVLNLADGYGGTGNWQWSASSPQGSGPPSGSGIYGHGSLMLPGNVMLVMGGYNIAASASHRKRDVAQQANGKSYLYNLTSNSWISDYHAPPASDDTQSTSHGGALSSPSQKVGLGVGLAVAVVALIALFIFYLWYKRRLRWKREQRRDELRSMQQGYVSDEWGMVHPNPNSSSIHPEMAGMSPRDTITDDSNSQITLRNSKPASSSNSSSMAENIVHTKGLRKSTAGRGPYPYERSIRNRDHIHPIAEGEETPQMTRNGDKLQEIDGNESNAMGKYSIEPDPFVDPLGSHPVNKGTRPISQVSASEEQEEEIRSWVTGWERAGERMARESEGAAVAGLEIPGRQSPTKSDRTLSNLSTISAISARSSNSGTASGPVSTLARTFSTRSAALLSSITSPFGTTIGSRDGADASGNVSPILTSKPNSAGSYSASSPTVRTKHPDAWAGAPPDFAKLQKESEALLGAYPPISRKQVPQPAEVPATSVPPRKAHPAGSWVGSVKRAIGISLPAAGRSTSLTASSARGRYTSSRTVEDDHTGVASASGISTNPGGVVVPRRSASDAAFWKSKRGAKDWGGEDDDDDEEWDVETAAQTRVVQLMFTVPREQLRVVNCDVDGRSIVSAEGENALESVPPGAGSGKHKVNV
ncbi:hypothetical protein BT63DRAFT_109599 [Microthyrium microscopicum]|uniref:Galactose oxidase n=1 Tax=Microthyrium microscopicum TaxID=703497 RepID=A0A6A6TWG5_9PEZI|nr:hypothetical protein BT63DRAFT_109599 [Microthyrium microscopicum]